MIALISDVHANLEALQAVLERLKEAEAIYSAGDAVGYGPNPNECCELLRERGVQSVKGNHDHICATLEDVEPCSPLARDSFYWTNTQLTEGNKEWLRSLPLELDAAGMSIVHGAPGSPKDMLNSYVLDRYYTNERYDKLLALVPGSRLVVGHTHEPLSHGMNHSIINPGSVGQPRDGDWRASYVTIGRLESGFRLFGLGRRKETGPESVIFQRAEYGLDATCAKILKSGLPDRLAKMLEHGGMHV